MIENDNDKIFHENDTNFNCINFTQTCRKSTFIGTVKVIDILLRLTGNKRNFDNYFSGLIKSLMVLNTFHFEELS